MKIVALEEHFTTPVYLEAVKGLSFAENPNQYMLAIQAKQADLGEGRLADMDAAGISIQVLSLSGILLDKLDAGTAAYVVRDANNTVAAAVQAYPDRFAAFAALAVKDPGTAVDELRRCVEEFGFKGGIINGTCDGQFMDSPRFSSIFEAADSLNVPIYLHPAPPPYSVNEAYYSGLPDSFGQMLSIAGWGWHVETGLHVLRLMVSGLFDRLPNLQIIIGHMGENLPFSIERAESVISHAPNRLEKSLPDYFRSNINVTTSGYFTESPFYCALDVIGVDRLLFSVDYPFSTNKQGRNFLDSLALSDEDKQKIAHTNAEILLGL
jgi:predicted TIM-barrel fold metal-dependent hydrolase